MNFSKPGTPEEYAEAFRQELVAGATLDELNNVNHYAFEHKKNRL